MCLHASAPCLSELSPAGHMNTAAGWLNRDRCYRSECVEGVFERGEMRYLRVELGCRGIPRNQVLCTQMQVLSKAEELGLQIIHGEPCVLVELGYYAPGGLGSSSSDGGEGSGGGSGGGGSGSSL